MYRITVDTLYCAITMKRRNGNQKVIRAEKQRDLWWIKNSEVFDLLIRGGFTTTEVSLFQMQASENLFYSALAASGNEKQKRKNPDSVLEYESDGDHLLGAESVKIRMNAFKEVRDFANMRTYAEPHNERRLYVRDDSVPLNSELRAYFQRKDSGKLWLKADVVEPTPEQI